MNSHLFSLHIWRPILSVAVFLLLWHPVATVLPLGTIFHRAWGVIHDVLLAGLTLLALPLVVRVFRKRRDYLFEVPLLYLALCACSVLPLLQVPTLGGPYVRMQLASLVTFASLYIVTYAMTRHVGGELLPWLFIPWISWALVSAIRGLERVTVLRAESMARIDIMGHTNSRAGFELLILLMLISVFVTLRRSWKIPATIILLVLGVSLLTSLSRGAWIGLSAGVGAIVFRRYGAKFAVPISLMICALILILPGPFGDRARDGLDPAFSTNLFRLDLWNDIAGLIKDSPWAGCGYDTLWFAMSGRLSGDQAVLVGRHAHNIFLHTWAELGFLGFASFLWLFAALIWSCWKGYSGTSSVSKAMGIGAFAAFAAILVHGIVDVTWRDYPQQILFWSLAGWATATFGTGTTAPHE